MPPIPEPLRCSWMLPDLLLLSFLLCRHHSPLCQDRCSTLHFSCPKVLRVFFVQCHFLSIFLCLYRFIPLLCHCFSGAWEEGEVTGHTQSSTFYPHIFCLPVFTLAPPIIKRHHQPCIYTCWDFHIQLSVDATEPGRGNSGLELWLPASNGDASPHPNND